MGLFGLWCARAGGGGGSHQTSECKQKQECKYTNQEPATDLRCCFCISWLTLLLRLSARLTPPTELSLSTNTTQKRTHTQTSPGGKKPQPAGVGRAGRGASGGIPAPVPARGGPAPARPRPPPPQPQPDQRRGRPPRFRTRSRTRTGRPRPLRRLPSLLPRRPARASLPAYCRTSVQAVARRFCSRDATARTPTRRSLLKEDPGEAALPSPPEELKGPASAQPIAQEPAARAHYVPLGRLVEPVSDWTTLPHLFICISL